MYTVLGVADGNCVQSIRPPTVQTGFIDTVGNRLIEYPTRRFLAWRFGSTTKVELVVHKQLADFAPAN
jgi:hypothetical protein